MLKQFSFFTLALAMLSAQAQQVKTSESGEKYESLAKLTLSNTSEETVSSNKVILERVYDTPEKVWIKLKTPLFQYKNVVSGKTYIVLSPTDTLDAQTGKIIHRLTRTATNIKWCLAEPCLLTSAFLLKACDLSQKHFGDKYCKSAYDEVKIDFSKINKLAQGEKEQFILKSRQVRVGKNRIDFFMSNNYSMDKVLMTKEDYAIDYSRSVFGKDKMTLLPEAEKQRRLAKAKKKYEQVKDEVNSQDIVDAEAFSAMTEPTEYVDTPLIFSDPTLAADPSGKTLPTDEVAKQNLEKSNSKIATKEICLDELNHVQSEKTVELTTNNNSSDQSFVTVVESSDSPIVTDVENNFADESCKIRKNNLLKRDSLAGLKNALPGSGNLVNDTVVK